MTYVVCRSSEELNFKRRENKHPPGKQRELTCLENMQLVYIIYACRATKLEAEHEFPMAR